MNRCLHRPAGLLARTLLLCAALWSATAATAQQSVRIPPIPATAAFGQLVVVAPPEVQLNGQPDRLSPGARIHATSNLLIMPASLQGQPLAVRYVRDLSGLLHEVWILTEAELQPYIVVPALPPY